MQFAQHHKTLLAYSVSPSKATRRSHKKFTLQQRHRLGIKFSRRLQCGQHSAVHRRGSFHAHFTLPRTQCDSAGCSVKSILQPIRHLVEPRNAHINAEDLNSSVYLRRSYFKENSVDSATLHASALIKSQSAQFCLPRWPCVRTEDSSSDKRRLINAESLIAQ